MEISIEHFEDCLKRAFLEGYRYYEPIQSEAEVSARSQEIAEEIMNDSVGLSLLEFDE